MSAPAPVAPLPGADGAVAPALPDAGSLDAASPTRAPSTTPQPAAARSGQTLAAELRGTALLFAFCVATTLGTVSALTALQRMI